LECNKEYVKSRKTWKYGDLETAIERLQKYNLKQAAMLLKVSPNSLRFALKRRGLTIGRIRRIGKSTALRRRANAPYIPPASTFNITLDSDLAVRAFELKPERGCSWPYGDLDKGDFRFCGEPRQSGKSYCANCAKLAYLKAK
jgi:hypothetical protein